MTRSQENKYDVAIVGAGPAGSSCAIRLAKSCFKVLLVEQKRFPRDKLCGEFISPECLSHFAELGVLEDMMHAGGVPLHRTVFYARNARSVTIPSEWFAAGSHALGLSRAEMDNRLFSSARTAGVEILEETHASGLIWSGDTVSGLELKDQAHKPFNVNARLVIDATGRSKVLARQVEKRSGCAAPVRTDFVAFKTHLAGAAVPEGDCEIYAYRGGYGGCSRVENDLHNLCFIVSAAIAKKYRGDANEIMNAVVFANVRAHRSLGPARVVGDWLAVPIQSYGRSELAPANGLLTIGDAAAFIDPFTGSGMLLALESAKIAADVVTRCYSSPDTKFAALARDFQSRYSAAFDRRLLISSVLRRAAFVPFLAEIMIRGLAFSESFARRVAKATRPAETTA